MFFIYQPGFPKYSENMQGSWVEITLGVNNASVGMCVSAGGYL